MPDLTPAEAVAIGKLARIAQVLIDNANAQITLFASRPFDAPMVTESLALSAAAEREVERIKREAPPEELRAKRAAANARETWAWRCSLCLYQSAADI